MQGVWGGTRVWIPVESYDDSTREGRTTATPLGPPDNWGAQDVKNEFSDEGRQTTVPGEGMPGGVRDTSGDAGALCAPARPRRRGYTGGGKPPPYHGASGATFRSPGRRSTGATWRPEGCTGGTVVGGVFPPPV